MLKVTVILITKKLIKNLIAFLMLLLFVCNSAIFVFADSPKLAARKVKVGYFQFNGYHDTDLTGYRSGYGYEYLHAMAKYNNWDFEYIDGTWAECQEMLQKGEIDILTSMQYSDERAQKYDFSEKNIGSSSAILTVKEGNENFVRGEFDTFKNMTIGIVAGNSRNDDLKAYSEKNNFTYTSHEFVDQNVMYEALMNGDIDAMLTSDLRKTNGEWVLARFAPSPFYVTVRKGNTVLLNEINKSLSKLEEEHPLLAVELHNKYYAVNDSAIMFSNAEREFIKNAGVVKVATWPDREPLSYFEKGECKGIVPDLMRLAASDLGLKIEFVETDTYAESCEIVQEGKADIMTNFMTDFDEAEELNVKLTSPYMNLEYCRVSKKGNLPEKQTIALPTDNVLVSRYVYENFSREQIFEYETTSDAIDAVRRGEADVTFANSIVTSHFMRKSENSGLIAVMTDEIDHSVSMAVSKYAPIEIYDLLNRELIKLKQTQLSNIITKHTMYNNGSVTWADYLYSNPVQVIFIGFVTMVFILICASVTLISRRKYVHSLKNLAFKDELTGLWNVAKLEQEAKQAINDNKRDKLSIVAMDIYKFRMINEIYGREIGDMIIKHMATELSQLAPTMLYPAHVKADNFLAIIYSNDRQEIEALFEKLRDKIFAFKWENQYISLSINCGLYIVNKKCKATTAIDNADKARRQSKSNSEGFWVYDETLETQLRKEKDIEDRFPTALTINEFEVYYQPKVNMHTNKICGAEALVRWNSSQSGFMRPDEFIPVLEKTGAIVELDFFVLEQVCKYVSEFLHRGEVPPKISVNQSRMHLPRTNYLSRLSDLIEKYAIPQGLIELELTETAFVDLDLTKQIVRKLKALGFTLSIDDFGSGYSSLTFLNTIQIDVMKIDRTFLQSTDSSQRTKIILKRMVDMAKDLNMEVVCEGVETLSQIQFLISIGCDLAQGYYYAQPMPKLQFDEKWKAN